MAEFKLDTSGTVENIGWRRPVPTGPRFWRWDTLPNAHFVQGSIRQALEGLFVGSRKCGWCPRTVAETANLKSCRRHAQCTDLVRAERVRLFGQAAAFHMLSPETLAMFVEDGARYAEGFPQVPLTAESGRQFWAFRQNGSYYTQFPPVTFSINDAGKIVHRVGA